MINILRIGEYRSIKLLIYQKSLYYGIFRNKNNVFYLFNKTTEMEQIIQNVWTERNKT